jgi:hypothetical protein
MSTPRRRLAIVAGALLLLTVAGAGLAEAAPSSTPAVAAAPAPAEPTPDQPGPLGERLRALRDRIGAGRLGRLREHLVHGSFTVLDRDGELMTIQLDHGTVAAIGDGSITISETGGTSVTVGTSAETRVRKGGEPASLAALAIGDEVVVHSVVEDGSVMARFVFVPPPAPARVTGDAA